MDSGILERRLRWAELVNGLPSLRREGRLMNRKAKQNPPDLSVIWREDADEAETIGVFQALVNSGQAWHMEGAVGRQAMDLINAGMIMLGEKSHTDYWGNYVPSRTEVKAGTKGSPEFVQARMENLFS